jgi:hypothetical protein
VFAAHVCFLRAEDALTYMWQLCHQSENFCLGHPLSVCFVFRPHLYTLWWDVTGCSFYSFVSYYTRHCHIGHRQKRHYQNLVHCHFNNTISNFNVFHVRALYYTKTLITNKCTKRVLSSIVTHSYMFRPCCVIFRSTFRYRYTEVALHS